MKRKKRHHNFKATPKRSVHFFDNPRIESQSVDLENGIIRGVSLITSGVTARGHDLEVDKKTLVQMLECATKKGKIKTKWNHKTGADAINGHLTNFQIVGDRLRADWQLLKNHGQYKQALELATEMADCVGLSASFTGDPEVKGGKNYARCDDLLSADLVADPAANPSGLFDSKVDSGFGNMADEQTTEERLLEMLEAQGEQIAELKSFQQQLLEQINADDSGDDEDEEDDDSDEFAAEDDDETEGEEEGFFAGVGGEVGAELNALRRQVHNLSSHLEAQEMQKVEAINDHAFSVLEAKTEALITELEQLRVENQILNEFRESVEARGGYSPSSADNHYHELNSKATPFEKRVHEFESAGKTRLEATKLALKEPGLYSNHLAAKGAVTHL